MATMTDTCWADPLSRKERAELSRKLARACKRFYDEVEVLAAQWPAHQFTDREIDFAHGLTMASAEMSDLHLDVTERAEVPAS